MRPSWRVWPCTGPRHSQSTLALASGRSSAGTAGRSTPDDVRRETRRVYPVLVARSGCAGCLRRDRPMIAQDTLVERFVSGDDRGTASNMAIGLCWGRPRSGSEGVRRCPMTCCYRSNSLSYSPCCASTGVPTTTTRSSWISIRTLSRGELLMKSSSKYTVARISTPPSRSSG